MSETDRAITIVYAAKKRQAQETALTPPGEVKVKAPDLRRRWHDVAARTDGSTRALLLRATAATVKGNTLTLNTAGEFYADMLNTGHKQRAAKAIKDAFGDMLDVNTTFTPPPPVNTYDVERATNQALQMIDIELKNGCTPGRRRYLERERARLTD